MAFLLYIYHLIRIDKSKDDPRDKTVCNALYADVRMSTARYLQAVDSAEEFNSEDAELFFAR